jgi:hypothetical protein
VTQDTARASEAVSKRRPGFAPLGDTMRYDVIFLGTALLCLLVGEGLGI